MGGIVSVREVDMVDPATVGVGFPVAGDSECPSVKHKILQTILFYFIEITNRRKARKF